MYPIVRLTKEMFLARRLPPLDTFDTHVSHHICWPWDLDIWMELNNGRTLTVYDLGRIPLAKRTGLITLMKEQRWGLTIAGSVVRYRRRVRMFDKVEIQSRLIGWDARFFYIEQSMWNTRDDCTSQAIFRAALTDANGIVTTQRACTAMKLDPISPQLPEWVTTWLKAEDQRPWPPHRKT